MNYRTQFIAQQRLLVICNLIRAISAESGSKRLVTTGNTEHNFLLQIEFDFNRRIEPYGNDEYGKGLIE